jgi:cytochrome P450
MRDFQRDKLGFIRGLTRYGDVVCYRTAHLTWYQINRPEGVRRVLQENNRNYGKGALTLGFFEPVVGKGLITSEGSLWLRQRRLMQPVFHRRTVAAFGTLMTDETLAMLERWRPAIEAREPLDVPGEMARLTLDIVTGALFHAHVGEEPETLARAVNTLVEDSATVSRCPSTRRTACRPRATAASRPRYAPWTGPSTRSSPSAAVVGELRKTCWRSSWKRATRRPARLWTTVSCATRS